MPRRAASQHTRSSQQQNPKEKKKKTWEKIFKNTKIESTDFASEDVRNVFQHQKDDMVGSDSRPSGGGAAGWSYDSAWRASEDAKLCRRGSPGCTRLLLFCSRLRGGKRGARTNERCLTQGEKKNSKKIKNKNKIVPDNRRNHFQQTSSGTTDTDTKKTKQRHPSMLALRTNSHEFLSTHQTFAAVISQLLSHDSSQPFATIYY